MSWDLRGPLLRRAAAWVGVAILCGLSLLPSDQDVDIDLFEDAHHFGAYLALSIASTAAYPTSRLRLTAGLIVLAAGLELLQHFSPGRTPSWQDFATGAAGVIVGVAIVRVFHRLLSGSTVGPRTGM